MSLHIWWITMREEKTHFFMGNTHMLVFITKTGIFVQFWQDIIQLWEWDETEANTWTIRRPKERAKIKDWPKTMTTGKGINPSSPSPYRCRYERFVSMLRFFLRRMRRGSHCLVCPASRPHKENCSNTIGMWISTTQQFSPESTHDQRNRQTTNSTSWNLWW